MAHFNLIEYSKYFSWCTIVFGYCLPFFTMKNSTKHIIAKHLFVSLTIFLQILPQLSQLVGKKALNCSLTSLSRVLMFERARISFLVLFYCFHNSKHDSYFFIRLLFPSFNNEYHAAKGDHEFFSIFLGAC